MPKCKRFGAAFALHVILDRREGIHYVSIDGFSGDVISVFCSLNIKLSLFVDRVVFAIPSDFEACSRDDFGLKGVNDA